MNVDMIREITASRILDVPSLDFVTPNGFSFFAPYLRFYVKEILEIGGEAYASKAADGALSGLFIYDEMEKTGTIFTKSRAIFDYFYGFKSSGWFFSELMTEHHGEIYDIYTLDLAGHSTNHTFTHEISMAEEREAGMIERFMASAHQGMNRKWVRVALENGETCFMVKLGDEIAGLGWASMVNGIGRLHSLFVRPQFRGMRMGEDILQARLLWFKSKRARWAFSEIARSNSTSSRIAVNGQMKVSGQVFQYFKKESGQKTRPEISSLH